MSKRDPSPISTKPGKSERPSVPSWRTLAQLVRLPNVFTAMADILLGWLAATATGTPAERWPGFLLLLLASACLYCSGMVWNDFFDLEQDRRERPFRPLPSGRVTSRQAASIGAGLMLAGTLLAILAGRFGPNPWRPFFGALALVAAIFLYDAWLKRTIAGPVAMGTCRFLNIWLGLSLAEREALPSSLQIYLGAIVGIYIVGVTWFARTEARVSQRPALIAASSVMLLALFLALVLPTVMPAGSPSFVFPYCLIFLGFAVGIPASQAISRPTPGPVQRTIKRAIMGLVILDAALATAFAGALGLLLLLLLLPALYLGRWIYST